MRTCEGRRKSMSKREKNSDDRETRKRFDRTATKREREG